MGFPPKKFLDVFISRERYILIAIYIQDVSDIYFNLILICYLIESLLLQETVGETLRFSIHFNKVDVYQNTFFKESNAFNQFRKIYSLQIYCKIVKFSLNLYPIYIEQKIQMVTACHLIIKYS